MRITASFDGVAGIGNVHVGDYGREGADLVLEGVDVVAFINR
ncbi:MAG: hypothetical protein ACUVVU_01110 [Tepidimonas sp.]